MSSDPSADPRPAGAGSAALGWALALVTLAYAAFAHYGFGPYPNQAEVPWWQPRGFLLGSSALATFSERPLLGVTVLAAPAFALAAGTFALTRSSLARTLALWGALATGFFLFYGLRSPGPQIWSFFGWRGSAVMILLSLALAGSLLAPLLAASWLRFGWPLRVALYLPVLAAVLIVSRNATGTNPSLAFNISPWPVVTVFGFDGLSTLLAGLLACLGLGLAGWQLRARHAALGTALIALAVAVPVVWGGLDLGGGLPLLLVSASLSAGALYAVARASGNLTMGLRSAAGHVALGALLLALPLFAGQGCVRLDYSATRDDRAQKIIDGLAAYYERETEYPEELQELLASGDLESIPEPRIGFEAFGRQGFIYQNFGTDYLLEFAAPGWTQCAYAPPWEDDPDYADEYEDEDEYADGGAGEATGESLPGSWTCPRKPPELW